MNISGFDLNLLKVLDALLREGSTVKAAERAGLSQPAVSAALGRLRRALGDPLFVRRGQGMEATDFARSLKPRLHEVLGGIESILAGPGVFDPSRSTQGFRLSGSDYFAEMLIPDLARTLAVRAPGMRLQLVDLVPDSYVDTLERYQVDIALIPRTDFPKWVDETPVFWSKFATVAARGNARLARAGISPGQTIPIDLFCDMGHVLFSPEGKLTAMGDAALARVGRERRIAMTLPVFGGVCRAVAASDLIALVPDQLARRMAPVFGLEVYQHPMKVDPVLISMIWNRRATSSPAHRWLRGQIAECLLALNPDDMPLPGS